MANKYACSDGSRISQSTIDRKRSETYKRLYAGNPHPSCAGCGEPAQGTAHLVPQSVCKAIGKTEYCWSEINMVPACHKCNGIMENPKSEEIKTLFCYEKLLQVTKVIHPERYQILL